MKNKDFDILKNTSEDKNLVQLMEVLRDVNRAFSVVGYWIFDYNYEKTLCLTQ